MKKLGKRGQFQQKFHLHIFRNKCIGLSFYCWKTFYFSKLYSSFVRYSQSANLSMTQNSSNFSIVHVSVLGGWMIYLRACFKFRVGSVSVLHVFHSSWTNGLARACSFSGEGRDTRDQIQLPKHILVFICITTVNITPLAKTSYEA